MRLCQQEKATKIRLRGSISYFGGFCACVIRIRAAFRILILEDSCSSMGNRNSQQAKAAASSPLGVFPCVSLLEYQIQPFGFLIFWVKKTSEEQARRAK